MSTNKNDTKNVKEVAPENSVRLASLLYSKILERKPDFRKPDIPAWAKHIDRMIRIDHRKPETIEKVIHWCQADSGNGEWRGWQNNILSTKKLREKFDKLELDSQKAVSSVPLDLEAVAQRAQMLSKD